MTHACEEHGVKLMIAYRLHFEPGNLKAIERIAGGELGEPRFFSSVFGQQVPEGNIRLDKSLDGGPLMDVGVYCINAARYLFRAEPEEVVGFGAAIKDDPRFTQIHEMAAVILRFPGERLASFTSSLGSAPVDTYTVVGTKGTLLSGGQKVPLVCFDFNLFSLLFSSFVLIRCERVAATCCDCARDSPQTQNSAS